MNRLHYEERQTLNNRWYAMFSRKAWRVMLLERRVERLMRLLRKAQKHKM